MELKLLNYNNERVLISSFYGKNRCESITFWQQKVFNYFGIPVNYIYLPFEMGFPYGEGINRYVAQTLDITDYYLFFDLDAIILKKDSIEEIIKKISDKKTVWGISQESTHIIKEGNTSVHPYAGFSCCGFSKELYVGLGKPTFSETYRGDIGEEVTYMCENLGYNVCLSYPVEYHELTDEEMANTGNARHGWVNHVGLGLGTTFGNGLVYHQFHTSLNPKTGKLAIPRAADLFIQKAKQAINYVEKPRKLELITGCVNNEKIKYSKFLEITLPLNKSQFDNILIVTSPDDLETQKVCKENGVDCFCTNEFFANGSKFDNNRAVSAALHKLKYKDWVISTSPDIIYPNDFREKLKLETLDENNMYGCKRAFINTYSEWKAYNAGYADIEDFEVIPGEGCGFMQCWQFNSPKLKGIPLEETLPSNGIALESDIWFLRRFHPDVRDVGKLDICLIHLGHKDWGGLDRDNSNKPIPFFFDE